MFGNNIDPLALEKISRLINSPGGNELKKQLKNIDRDSLMKMFGQLNVSKKDIENFSDKIKETSQEDLLNEILKKVRKE
ncbi:MAG: hypothetical protein IJE46_03655 [Clostridia bacterium]|nr:hypothetical protein [Clostridia bacterium]